VSALAHPSADLALEIPRSPNPLIERIVRYIEENYHRRIRPRDVACAINYSPSHLAHVMRQWTGYSLGDLIFERRMGASAQLLAQTSLAIAEVAERVGFSDTAYFSRRFARHYGSTPSRWRELHQVEQSRARRFCLSCGRELEDD
jgi:AraC-like DNA-binding protein